MAGLPEEPFWHDDIYLLQKTDPASGGAEINALTKQGILNLPPKQLADRTRWLKKRLDEMRSVENIYVEVGAGGDFPSIAAALAELSKLQRGWSAGELQGEIHLRAGYVMEQSVPVIGIDLSWLAITGADAVTSIARASLDQTDIAVGGAWYAFMAALGGRLPRIGQLFQMDTTGPATGRHGVLLVDGYANVASNCGVTFAGGDGLHLAGGQCYAEGSNFDNAGRDGVRLTRVSQASLDGMTARDCGSQGLRVWKGSQADANGGDFRRALVNGIWCSRGGVVNAHAANARINGTTDDPADIVVEQGGKINASSASGGTNIAKNTLTANGIING